MCKQEMKSLTHKVMSRMLLAYIRKDSKMYSVLSLLMVALQSAVMIIYGWLIVHRDDGKAIRLAL
jgi:hypothetical protein